MLLSRGPESKARKDAREKLKARKDAREKLKALWELNSRRSEYGWPPTPLDLERLGGNPASFVTFDALGRPKTMTVRGKRMRIALRQIVRYSVKLGNKVRGWRNNKEISGEDVMEILGIALELTNDPAYAAARKAMMRHGLDTGGLKRGFATLHRRHHEPPEISCAKDIDWYRDAGYSLREAAEYVVANEGIPGTSFPSTVDKVRTAYNKSERLMTKRRRDSDELRGERDPNKNG